jgi:hypothetical protein
MLAQHLSMAGPMADASMSTGRVSSVELEVRIIFTQTLPISISRKYDSRPFAEADS